MDKPPANHHLPDADNAHFRPDEFKATVEDLIAEADRSNPELWASVYELVEGQFASAEAPEPRYKSMD